MRVLVTGATGLIGTELLRAAPADWELVCVGRTRPARGTWVETDLAAPGFAATLDGLGPVDVVAHLAQARAYRSFDDAADVVAVNVTATAALLERARTASVERFVLASTGTVYRCSADPLAEDAPLRTRSVYACSKRAAEVLSAPYAELMQVRALRIFTAFGGAPDGRLVADLVDRVRTGRAVQLRGERGLLTSPMHATDAAAAVIAALERDAPAGEVDVVNVGGPPLSIRDMAVEIGTVLGREPVFEHLGGAEPGGYVADRTKAATVLGLASPTPFGQALAQELHAGTIREAPGDRPLRGMVE